MTVADFNKCSNCGACYNACREAAITIDKSGFFYNPIVDTDKCINCGLCIRVCPVNELRDGFLPLQAYAGWCNDEKVVLSSSSGGAFYGIAQGVISEGGVVFGAGYSEDLKEIVFSSTDEKPIEFFQKSKYVESLVGNSFVRIKEELDSGRKVLFCGTPCQVAGLKCFLNKEYSSLLTCDFACGGLPSHRIYQDHLKSIEKKYRSRAVSVDFRPKTHGWKRYAITVELENGRRYNRLGTEDPYVKSFLYGQYTVRDYCLECDFSNHHFSDITIADFWMHRELSDLCNEEGISLILCNTEKGCSAVNSLGKDYFLKEIDVKKASYNNKRTQLSESLAEKHNSFLKMYKALGADAAFNHFLPVSFKGKMKNVIARFIYRKKRGRK